MEPSTPFATLARNARLRDPSGACYFECKPPGCGGSVFFKLADRILGQKRKQVACHAKQAMHHKMSTPRSNVDFLRLPKQICGKNVFF